MTMRIVIDTDEQYKNLFLEIANSIKAKISFNSEDLYENLPEHVKKGVEKSREEIERGDFSTDEVVINKFLTKYK
jgi:hypothetical protein